MTDDALPWHLSGFGDEIDPDPRVQVAVLQALGARHLEVRSAWGTNVADFSPGQAKGLRSILDAADHGRQRRRLSPGQGRHLRRRPARSTACAARPRPRTRSAPATCGSSRSTAPQGVPAEAIRDDVLSALAALADVARSEDLVLLHENEKEIYGDTPERVLDLARNVASPALRLAWDAANFVQVGVRPHTAAWADLAPYVEYLQVKDAVLATGQTCPAGDGDGEIEATVTALAAAGYRGFASLEPHLTEAGRDGRVLRPGRVRRRRPRLRPHHRSSRSPAPMSTPATPPPAASNAARCVSPSSAAASSAACMPSVAAANPDLDVVAVVDPHGERAADVAAILTGAGRAAPAAYPDLGAALAAGGVDVVAVCTPSGDHAALAVQALEAGAHVVVEKPLDVAVRRGPAPARRPRRRARTRWSPSSASTGTTRRRSRSTGAGGGPVRPRHVGRRSVDW